MNNRNMKNRPLRTAVWILVAAATAIGCGWSTLSDDSVRFNAITGRAFYRLPPLPLLYDKTTGNEISANDWGNYTYSDESYEERQKKVEEMDTEVESTWEAVRSACESDDIDEAEESLSKVLNLTEVLRPESGLDDEQTQQGRNSAYDMLDALSSRRQGASPRSITAYMRARLAYDEDPKSLNLDALVLQAPDKPLQDNWAYLRSASAYVTGDKASALAGFRDHVSNFPKSEKNEAAMYMAAKLTMEFSHSYENTRCGIVDNKVDDRWGPQIDLTLLEPQEKCQDDNWRAAIGAFQSLMLKHPNGRYFDDARGWLAYLYRRGGERAKALAEYYRMLGHPTDWPVRLEAKKSLQMIGHKYDDTTLNDTEQLIEDDVDAAMAYAYHRIYNHAIDLTYDEMMNSMYSFDDRREEQERHERVIKEGNHELDRIAQFATRMMKRHAQARVSGGFVLRVAQAQLELERFADARDLARKALLLGVSNNIRAQALWVKGSGEHKLKELKAARTTFEQLIREFPQSKYTEGSRRILAMVAEDRGDLESALEMYIDLKYESDVAYFVDLLIPTDRLAKFVADRPAMSQHNALLYAVGVRYMREKRWDEARNTLRKVQTEKGEDGYLSHDKEATWYFPKEPGLDGNNNDSYIKSSWVMQDLKTIDIFEHYERAAATAQGDEAKAEALFQLASAYFEADDLLFYNPDQWRGGRVSSLAWLHFTPRERFSGEAQLIFEHLNAHDPWARSIPIYEEIVARFPTSKLAPDALYSAAVAHEKLSSRNSLWSEVYERGLFPGPRVLTYADVRSTYPGYQLPRGTYGWEPSTRTVNGGPGWDPPAKPLPRETREQKIKRLAKEFKGELTRELSNLAAKLSTGLETRLDAGVDWYTERVQAAVYGVITGVLIWIAVLIGIGLHSQRFKAQLLPESDEPSGADSRVDKMIQ